MGALRRRLCCIVAFATTLAFAPAASASFHLWKIEQVFSNADGTVQFVVLHESTGSNGEQFLRGHAFQATHAGASPIRSRFRTTFRAMLRQGAGS